MFKELKMKSLYSVLILMIMLPACGPKKSVLNFMDNSRNTINASNAQAILEQGGLSVRMSDRYYVSSVLTNTFGPSVSGTLINYVKSKMDYFGGGCDQYDRNVNSALSCLNDDCDNVSCSGSLVINNQIGNSSVIRQGWIMRSCEEIAGNDAAILFAVQNIYNQAPLIVVVGSARPIGSLTAGTVPAPNNDSLVLAYALFYRSVAPNAAIISSLTDIASKETTNNFEKWRYVLLSLCTTSEWQIP